MVLLHQFRVGDKEELHFVDILVGALEHLVTCRGRVAQSLTATLKQVVSTFKHLSAKLSTTGVLVCKGPPSKDIDIQYVSSFGQASHLRWWQLV